MIQDINNVLESPINEFVLMNDFLFIFKEQINKNRSAKLKTCLFNSKFCTTLKSEKQLIIEIRKMKNFIFNFELILVPIFDQNEWLLIVVQVEKKCLTLIDPPFGEREN
jgi:Ulp1 family protease